MIVSIDVVIVVVVVIVVIIRVNVIVVNIIILVNALLALRGSGLIFSPPLTLRVLFSSVSACARIFCPLALLSLFETTRSLHVV